MKKMTERILFLLEHQTAPRTAAEIADALELHRVPASKAVLCCVRSGSVIVAAKRKRVKGKSLHCYELTAQGRAALAAIRESRRAMPTVPTDDLDAMRQSVRQFVHYGPFSTAVANLEARA
jgi:predicted ArsR family transcriptional regulator